MYQTISLHFLTAIGLGALHVLGVSSLSLTITPDHVTVSVDPTHVTVTCTAHVSLAGCQFTWHDLILEGVQTSPRPLLELSRGHESRPNASHLESGLTGYSYSGRGLGAGDCGVKLELKDSKEWMVGCRVRTSQSSWSYAWIKLYAWVRNTLPVTVSPREAVVLPGEELTVLCRTPEPLESCRFFLPGSECNVITFDQGAESPDSGGRFLYHGDGLEYGECGIRVKNVTELDNEPIQCYVCNANENEMRVVPVIVASPPGPAVLHVTYRGHVLEATCSVGPSRPVARITWLLDDEVIRQDADDDSPGDPEAAWAWPWVEASISQSITHTLRPQDKGGRLKCVTSHQALLRPTEATADISF